MCPRWRLPNSGKLRQEDSCHAHCPQCLPPSFALHILSTANPSLTIVTNIHNDNNTRHRRKVSGDSQQGTQTILHQASCIPLLYEPSRRSKGPKNMEEVPGSILPQDPKFQAHLRGKQHDFNAIKIY